MQPSELGTLFYSGSHFKQQELVNTVKSSFSSIHDLKMRVDEPEIKNLCQQLINLLFIKYPGFAPKPE